MDEVSMILDSDNHEKIEQCKRLLEIAYEKYVEEDYDKAMNLYKRYLQEQCNRNQEEFVNHQLLLLDSLIKN